MYIFITGSEISDVVNCRNGVVVERFKVGDFWQGFESIKGLLLRNNFLQLFICIEDLLLLVVVVLQFVWN